MGPWFWSWSWSDWPGHSNVDFICRLVRHLAEVRPQASLEVRLGRHPSAARQSDSITVLYPPSRRTARGTPKRRTLEMHESGTREPGRFVTAICVREPAAVVG